VVMFGGMNGNSFFADVFLLRVQGLHGEWERRGKPANVTLWPSERAYHSASLVQGSVIVYG
jgi:hypothetical protein